MASDVLSDDELEQLSSWPPESPAATWPPTSPCRSTTCAGCVPTGGHGAGRPRRTDRRARFLASSPQISPCTPEVVQFVAKQVGAAPASFTRYARDVDGRTRRRHVAAVVEQAGWRTCGRGEWKALGDWLVARALEHDAPSVLFAQALGQLRAERVVRPGLDRLARTVGTARVAAGEEIRRRLGPELTPEAASSSTPCWSPTRT